MQSRSENEINEVKREHNLYPHLLRVQGWGSRVFLQTSVWVTAGIIHGTLKEATLTGRGGCEPHAQVPRILLSCVLTIHRPSEFSHKLPFAATQQGNYHEEDTAAFNCLISDVTMITAILLVRICLMIIPRGNRNGTMIQLNARGK